MGRRTFPRPKPSFVDFLRNSKASLGGSKSLVDLSGENQSTLRFMTSPQPGRADRLIAAPSQGPGRLLPWRRAAHRRLALHWRTARHQSRSQLRMGARQSRRALCRRCLRGDVEGQCAAQREVTSPSRSAAGAGSIGILSLRKPHRWVFLEIIVLSQFLVAGEPHFYDFILDTTLLRVSLFFRHTFGC